MKLLVTGSDGQVGTEYQLSKPIDGWDYIFLSKKDLDITKLDDVALTLRDICPSAVLNLAAYTDVKQAEADYEQSFRVNSIGPRNLAIVADEMGIPIIHISTEYVFDGEGGSGGTAYTETSEPNPLNNYGKTKLLGEDWIRKHAKWHYIIRSSWIYSNHGKNFYNSVLSLAQERSEINVVNDQFGSPTSAKELIRGIDKVISNMKVENSGTYHFSSLGKTSWKDFTVEIFYQAKIAVQVKGIPTDNVKAKVVRPLNSWMSSEKFSETFSYVPWHWKNSLREVLSERKILPVKVGDRLASKGEELIIVSTDWLKKTARVSLLKNMKESVEVPFEILQNYDKQ